MRARDSIRHNPTGEKWIIMAIKFDELIPCGWPLTVAKISDCKLTQKCSDDEHLRVLKNALECQDNLRRAFAHHEMIKEGLVRVYLKE